jgi:lysozyme family protein
MKDNFDSALKAILHHEGGFVNHPADPGGMTNLGVTKRVWEEWVGHEVDEKTMRALTPETVAPMYKAKYWDRIKGDDLPDGVDYSVFDAAINSGPGRAAKWLQQAVGAVPDGAIGPGTLGKVAAMPASDIVEKYQQIRLEFLQSLPTWSTFGKGWGRRVQEVQVTAAKMTESAA